LLRRRAAGTDPIRGQELIMKIAPAAFLLLALAMSAVPAQPGRQPLLTPGEPAGGRNRIATGSDADADRLAIVLIRNARPGLFSAVVRWDGRLAARHRADPIAGTRTLMDL
jgi:hypothetical protein